MLILHGCHGNVIFFNSGLFITADRKNLDTRTMFYQKIPVADPYTLLPPGLIILDFAARLHHGIVKRNQLKLTLIDSLSCQSNNYIAQCDLSI